MKYGSVSVLLTLSIIIISIIIITSSTSRDVKEGYSNAGEGGIYEKEQVAILDNDVEKAFNAMSLKVSDVTVYQDTVTINETRYLQKDADEGGGNDAGDLLRSRTEKVLIKLYPECTTEISKLKTNNRGVMNCVNDIKKKKSVLTGFERDCGVDQKTSKQINIKEADLKDIVSCVQRLIYSRKVSGGSEPIVLAGYLPSVDKTSSGGVAYSVKSLEQVDAKQYNSKGNQIPYTSCGVPDAVPAVGYDITLIVPGTNNRVTICIFEEGEIILQGAEKKKIINQTSKTDTNDWYEYNKKDNECYDWGVYIPHNYTTKLNILERTSGFVFYGDHHDSAGVKNKSVDGKHTLYYSKDYCDKVNKQVNELWYRWDPDKNTDSCKTNKRGCCVAQPHNLSDDSIKNKFNLIRANQPNTTVKQKSTDKTMTNLYQYENQCNLDNEVHPLYVYDIDLNRCTLSNANLTPTDAVRHNNLPDNKKDIRLMYYSHDHCNNLIKRRYYIYSYDNELKANKCIPLRSCSTYGDPSLCSYTEMNAWILQNGYDVNKIYTDATLNECKDTHERKGKYLYNSKTDNCDKLTHDAVKKLERDGATGNVYYDTLDTCVNNNIKYLAYDVGDCSEITSASAHAITNAVRVVRNEKKQTELGTKMYVKLKSDIPNTFGISNRTQIWSEDGRHVLPEYNKAKLEAVDTCLSKHREAQAFINN